VSDLGIATPVVRIGWPDRFIEHGKVDALRAKYGLTVDGAMEKLAPYLAARVAAEARVRSAKAR